MFRALTLLFTLLATPVISEQIEVVIFSEPDPEDGAIGVVIHHNQHTMMGEDYNGPRTFETELGEITVVLEMTKNNSCEGPEGSDCPDSIEIWDLPQGIVADSFRIETPEGNTSSIRLFRSLGS